MDTKFTEQESLQIINKMVQQAQNNFQQGSGNPIILSGLSVAVIALLDFVLLFVLDKSYQAHWVWCLMIPCTGVIFNVARKARRNALAKTHLDRVIQAIWGGFSITAWMLVLITLFLCFSFKNFLPTLLITPLMLLLTGFSQFVTAQSIRFKPYLFGALVMFAGALLCLFSYIVFRVDSYQFLILSLCMIFGFVVPGYLLNRKSKQHV